MENFERRSSRKHINRIWYFLLFAFFFALLLGVEGGNS